MVMSAPDPHDPRMTAGIDLLRRTGMRQFQLRYSDDEQPVVWMAVGKWFVDAGGRPRKSGGTITYESASALDPVRAVLRLCDTMLDGGFCLHCKRPSGVTEHWSSEMPLAELVCWYIYDPELEKFRRSCEGDT
jgi:hypothetical protein